MSCQLNISSLNIFPLKNFPSFKFRILNMITVCCRFARSFKTVARHDPVALQFSLSVPFNEFALVERAKAMFGLSIALKDVRPKFMSFGLSPRTELVRFTRLLRSKSVTISPGRLFTPIFQCKISLNSFIGPQIRQRKCSMARCSSTILSYTKDRKSVV